MTAGVSETLIQSKGGAKSMMGTADRSFTKKTQNFVNYVTNKVYPFNRNNNKVSGTDISGEKGKKAKDHEKDYRDVDKNGRPVRVWTVGSRFAGSSGNADASCCR